MGRTLDTGGIKELLYRNLEHPRWDDVAARCLACTNCTLVCPTCFCSTVEDVSDLDRRDAPSAGGAGTRASRSSTPTSTAAASACPPRSAIGSGSRTSWRAGSISSAPRAASAAGAASPGARSGSTSPRRWPRSAPATARLAHDRSLATTSPSCARTHSGRVLTEPQLERLVRCASVLDVPAGAFVFREGGPADGFFLLRGGRVALEQQIPGQGTVQMETLRAGDILGFSWMFPPRAWTLDARAVEPTELLRARRPPASASRCRRTRPSAWPSPCSSITSSTCASSACACSASTCTGPGHERRRRAADEALIPVPVRVRAVDNEIADVVTLRLEGVGAARRVRARPVQHALRVRRRRGGDLGERRPGRARAPCTPCGRSAP